MDQHANQLREVISRTLSTRLVGLLNGLDDTDSDGLPHVTDGETSERSVLVVLLNTHGLGGDEGGNASITGLDELGGGLDGLAGTTIDLLDELLELASNVGGVAIEDGSVTGTDLTRVVEDDDLGGEGSSLPGGVVLGVGSNVTTTDILDGDVPEDHRLETSVAARSESKTHLTLKPTLSPGLPCSSCS